MQNEAWLEFFGIAVEHAGIPISKQQRELFLHYMLELLDWNRSTNITRIVDPRAVAIKHFLDSILITRYIDIAAKSIADIGSGGGFPGIPLAILEPGCSVVLIESIGKKCAFLKHAVRSLQLQNVEIYNGRAQSYPSPSTFDLAISRAFGSLAQIIAIAAPLIKTRGSIVCMKGRLPTEDIEAVKTTLKQGDAISTHTYCLPEQGDARSLVVVQPCFT